MSGYRCSRDVSQGRIVGLKEISVEDYSALIGHHSKTSFFHTKEWLEVLEEGFPSINIKLFALIGERGEPVGVLPVELRRKLIFRLAGSPLPGLFTPYQGPLFFDSYDPTINELAELVAGLEELVLQALNPHFFTIAVPPAQAVCSTDSVSPGWSIRKTIYVDLAQSVEQLWKKLNGKTRNEVRQAERRGVEICEADSEQEWLDDYWQMHKNVYERQNMRPPGSLEFYRSLWKHLYSRGQLKVILAKHQGKTIAGGIFLIDQDTIYYLDGASFNEYRVLRGNNLIQWHVLQWASLMGLRLYDMVGANIPSIAHFKRGFGGTEVVYPYFQSTYKVCGNIGIQMYERFRPLVKRLGL